MLLCTTARGRFKSLAKHPVEQHRQPHGRDSELALDDTAGLHVLVEGGAEDDMVGARCCAAYDGAVTEAVRVARGRVERLLSLGGSGNQIQRQ